MLVRRPPRARPRTYASETVLQKAVVARFGLYGGMARKVHGGAYGTTGEPDIDGCVAGRSVKVELKVGSNRPTPAQMHRLREWQQAGALAGWCRSLVELDELLDHLEDLAWRNPQLERAVAVA